MLVAQVQAMPGLALLVADLPEMVAQVASIQLIFLDLVENLLLMVAQAAPKEIFTEASVVLVVVEERPGARAVAEDILEAEQTIRLEVGATVRARAVADHSLQVPTNNSSLVKAMVQVL